MIAPEDQRQPCRWQPLIDAVREALRDLGMTPADLSREANIPQNTLSGMLNGLHAPDAMQLLKLARFFRRPVDQLLALAGTSLSDLPERDCVRLADDPEAMALVRYVEEIWPKLSAEDRRFYTAMVRRIGAGFLVGGRRGEEVAGG